MSWRDVLPINRIELWMIRIALVIGFMAIGAVLALIYTRNDFERGMNYMQKAYTTPGMVTREVH